VNVKTVAALAVLTAVLTPAAYAVGQSRDPRVPALERRLATVQRQVQVLREQAATVDKNFVKQNIDLRVLAFCDALLATSRTFSSTQLATEPAFASFLTSVTGEGSSTFACPAPAASADDLRR
jgi:hypothetical protein